MVTALSTMPITVLKKIILEQTVLNRKRLTYVIDSTKASMPNLEQISEYLFRVFGGKEPRNIRIPHASHFS